MTDYGRKLSPSSNIATVLGWFSIPKLRLTINEGEIFEKGLRDVAIRLNRRSCVGRNKVWTKIISQD